MDFFEWSQSDSPARIVDLRLPGALAGLVDEYGASAPWVPEKVFSQAFALGAQMAVIEYRYMDADYRNEHSRLNTTTFRRYPSVAHCIHFFKEPPPAELADPVKPATFANLTYLGFCVLRPVPGAPVGRTMLIPPKSLSGYVTCQATSTVNFFGVDYRVHGSPFMAQDAQLGVCAHTTVWVTAHYHHLKFGSGRVLPGMIADAVPAEVGLGRPMPSTGLTVAQISEACRRIGYPPVVYGLDPAYLPSDESLFRIACRYLNSGLPVIVAGGRHAWVLVGYKRTKSITGDARIHFIRQDDEVGPYQVVENPLLDDYKPWDFIVAPLPQKVYLAGEKAEAVGGYHIKHAAGTSNQAEAQSLATGISNHDVSFRSRVMLSNEFKASLENRGVPEPVRAIYQRMHMSRWIWVVEAAYIKERDEGLPCVASETIIDATDHVRDLHVLARRIPGNISVWIPDRDVVGRRNLEPIPLLPSVCLGETKVS